MCIRDRPKSEPHVPEGAEPLALRNWYGYTAAWQQELAKQNKALQPDELTVLDGKTVFLSLIHISN